MAVRRGVGTAVASIMLLAAPVFLVPNRTSAYTVKQTSSGATVRWHTNDVSLRIDPSMYEFFPDLGIFEIVSDAAVAWHGLPGSPDLLINEGVPGVQGFEKGRTDNGVYLVKDWELQENALAVTVATFETKSGKIVDADVLVNANHPFGFMPQAAEELDQVDPEADAFDLAAVMTHEMGHVLGLGESYDERMATMWPSVARGETHQRDIHEDDQAGVTEAYAETILSEVEDGGCGGSSSVAARRPETFGIWFWLILAAAIVATRFWLRHSAATSGQARAGAMLAFVLLFGAGSPGAPAANEKVEVLRTLALRRLPYEERRRGLSAAAHSESTQVRLAAVAVLERAGAREDVALASKLALDEDAEVRRVARQALERLRTAPPRARLKRSHARAKQRVAAFLGDASDVVEGEAVIVGVEHRKGLFWSHYLVHGKERVVEVKIPGGTVAGYTQVVSEQEAPTDGDTLVVALRKHGPAAWAHLRDGVVYGGHLGEGPAIQWTPSYE